MGKIDTQQLIQGINLIKLAACYTELHNESTKEFSGPCPKCGGHDRFHVTANWFFCRQCHEKRGDAIEYMRWLRGVDFREACALLSGGATLSVATTAPSQQKLQTQQKERIAWHQDTYETLVTQAHKYLFHSQSAEAGRVYLQRRCLEPHTWLTFQLGYSESMALPGTEGKLRAPAIVIPWYRAGRLCAVRFRFLTLHEYTDAQRRTHQTKQTSRGRFTGVLYGGHSLTKAAEAERTLVICEGEINAVSIWQITQHTGLDVLSLGSESQKLTPAMIQYARKFKTVIVWADRRNIAKQLMMDLPGAYGVQSPDGQDANDLLQASHLGGYLSAWRYHACKDNLERRQLFEDLLLPARLLQGIDIGTAQMLTHLANELGLDAAIYEAEQGRWITENT